MKQFNDNHGEHSVTVDVTVEVNELEPLWSQAEGTLELIHDKVEGEQVVVGFANPALFVIDQEGDEYGEYENYKSLFDTQYMKQMIEDVEYNLHPADFG